MPRADAITMAERAEAKVRRARAEYELERFRNAKVALRERRRMLSIHRAAEQNRFTNDWTAPTTSADGSILPDLIRINARARQLIRDDAYARSILRSFRRNVVGTGITPSIDDRPFAKDWHRWSRNAAVLDLERRRTLVGIQQWAIDEAVGVGEAFVVRWITNDNYFGRQLKLQCFEFEQLDRYKISHTMPDGTINDVRHGIEVDINGAPVAYHFYRRHPNDVRGLGRPAPLMLESFRVPASMVCHVYDPDRVRQTHGISRLAPVLRKIRDLSEYDAAQLRVARAEASIGLIIKGTDDGTDPLELDGLNVAYVGENESVTSFTPSRPGNTYEPFTLTQLKAIAAGAGTSYEQVARDNTNGTYSSGRMTALDDRREFEPLQQLLIDQLCTPVMNDFMFVWHLNYSGPTDYFLRDEVDPINWQGQGWEWVDPEAQGKAIERQMALRLTSRTIEANRLGRNVKLLDEQIAVDGTQQIIDEMNKSPSPANPAPVPALQPEVVDVA